MTIKDVRMSRHKHKNPRVKVYFRNKGRCFRLLEAINFGSKSSPELKIKGLTETTFRRKMTNTGLTESSMWAS